MTVGYLFDQSPAKERDFFLSSVRNAQRIPKSDLYSREVVVRYRRRFPHPRTRPKVSLWDDKVRSVALASPVRPKGWT